ncbi:MAG TPA: TonB-dependent receptor [Acidobacteriaceae bacterium]|nr:TonB-dependent receptor [Acidobacteriaceae bacterium]
MSKMMMKCLSVLGLMFAFSTLCALGQSSGSISGTVKDSTGAIIPNATVSAKNIATGVQVTRTTNDSGFYLIQVPAGDYRVEASAAGFQSIVHEKITVDALASIPLDLSLSVGSATQQVTVSAVTDTIQTDNTTLGTTLRNEVYAALPLQMSQGVPRDPTSFISLAPGVAAVVLQSAGPSYTSFNGAQQEVNGLYFEGLPVSFPNQMGDTRPLALAVSVDAVNQFQVEINGEKAEYQGQGFHNYVLKSGGNQFHGNLFEFFRNTSLDAKSYFGTYVPADHQNEYGGNVSGPFKKDKLFFFGNYDTYTYNTTSNPQALSIPSLLERSGNFSEVSQKIYDPLTLSCSGSTCTKQQFANNIIPASRLAPLHVGPSFQSYLPTPTASGISNNYSSPLKRAIKNRNTTVRVDYNINPAHLLYGVFAYGKWSTDYTGNLTPTGTALPLPYTSSPGIVIERPLIAQVHETWTISPSLLNNLGIGFVRLSIPIFPITQAGKYPQAAGLTGLPGNGQAALGFPSISFSGSNVPAGWASTGPFNEWENDVMGQDSLTWVHGRHAFKFGFTYQSTQDNRGNPADGTSASFAFTPNETAGFKANSTALDTSTGNAYASYLLGAVSTATINNNTVVETGSRFHNYSLFAQDDWKLLPQLTLNLGLRWDVYSPFGEEHNRYSIVDPTLANPAANNVPGALVYGKQLVKTHYKNFQPRLGIAYQINDKTVLRTGFVLANTMGTLGLGGNGPNGPGQNGYNPPSSIRSFVTGAPAFYWDSGVPTPVTPVPVLTSGFGVGNSTANPAGAIGPPILWSGDLAGRAQVYMNFSFGLQRELPGRITLGATYSGSLGRFLSRYNAVGPYTNSMDPKYLALGSLLSAQATSSNIATAQSMFPEIHLPFSNFQGTMAAMLAPFPQYASAGTSCYSCNEASSTYHSMQITVQRHLTNGLQAQLAYTLSKEIDDINGAASQLGAVTGGTRNPYNHTWDRGMGLIDRRHNLHLTWVYDLPAGKGHLLSGGAIGDAILGNWQWSGIYNMNTGVPMGVTGTKCLTPGISSTCMVSLTPGYTGKAQKMSYSEGHGQSNVSYLDVGAFVDPANYTFGNVPRSAPYGLRAPTFWEVDSTLRRTFPIKERLKFQLSADFFNLLNNVIFAPPATNIDASNYGTVSSTQNQSRHIQFSGRFTF